MITDDDIAKAWAAFARTPDGQVAYLHLQKVLMEVIPRPEGSALHADYGRRYLARELMGLMAPAIAESSGDGSDQPNGRPSERPVVFAPGRTADTGRRRSFRDHAIANDPELQRAKRSG